MYRCRLGLSEHEAHLFDDLGIGLDKVLQFLIDGSLPEQPRPVRSVIEHRGNVVHRAVRHAMHAGDILQGGLELHRGEGSRGEDPSAAGRIVPLFEILLDLLTAVGGIVYIDIGERCMSSRYQSFVHKTIRHRYR